MRTTKHLCREIISRSVETLGYRVSGNHIFTAVGYEQISRGRMAYAVAERPASHTAYVVRAAEQLADTYTR